MQRPAISVVSFIVVAVLALSFVAAHPDQKEPQTSLLSSLQKGQTIVLKDLGTTFEIIVFPNGPVPLGFEVTEIGTDFVAVKDVTGTREVRSPVYSIRAITTMKIGGK